MRHADIIGLLRQEIREITGAASGTLQTPSLEQILLAESLDTVASATSPCYAVDHRGSIVGLNLEGLWLTALPESLFSLDKLQVLRLHRNHLFELPEAFAHLSGLRQLYLGHNAFSEIPEVLASLKQLEVLALNQNRLSSVPDHFRFPSNLRKIGLAGNRLSTLPDDLLKIPALKGLFVGRNDFAEVPGCVMRLRAIEQLDVSRNPIKNLAAQFGDLQTLRWLSLRETELRHFPACLLQLNRLEHLDLNGVAIPEVPSGIGALKKLKFIDLNGTQIQALPEDFSELEELQSLNLSSLRLTGIPNVVFKLRSLKELNLSGTRVRALPSRVEQLTQLVALDLSSMSLLTVPPGIFLLPQLRRLNLSGNRLRELPWQLSESPLDVYWNRKGRTEGIFLDGNPLESPPPEIVRKGSSAVQAYYNSLGEARRPIDEVKVLLVGDGGAGKTSLVRRLMNLGHDENEPQTHGININDQTVNARGKFVKVHFWDFGGQEIMHATHQFFLSKRSAYILVLDGRKDEKVEYWMKHVESFGGDSPVIVVINKVDENASFDLNRRFLADKYPSIKGFHRISCRYGTGIRQLETALANAIARIEHTNTRWPGTWFRVKERLERMAEDYISHQQFEEICQENGVSGVDSQETLVEFLHDLGIILRFTDLPLRDTNVINPRWLTGGVYKIVNAERVSQAGGILPIRWLSELLDPHDHPRGTHNFIVELMKKFELCYQVDRERLLLPGLLPIEEPEIRFPSGNRVRFVVNYDFLPKSVMPRLIVRMHADIEQDFRWRTGVVLQNQLFDARAIVRSDEVDRKIEITVHGRQRREYLGVILHTLREINKSFEKLHYVERVPMPDNEEVMVSYTHLLRLENRGITHYIPDGSDREYPVQELLGYVQPARRTEDEILELLRHLKAHNDTEETLLEKANRSVMLQPNFFGLGINLNELIRRVVRGQ